MVTPPVIVSIFEPKIRLTGVALCYNIGFTVFGAMAPLIIMNMIKLNYNIYLTPCIYLLIMIAISGMGLSILKKNNHKMR